MVRSALLTLCTMLLQASMCQQGPFDYGSVSVSDLQMTRYDRDTSATSVYLREFGEAHIESQDPQDLIFLYHAIIKVLRPEGVDDATWEVGLYNEGSNSEELTALRATTYNLSNGTVTATDLDPKSLITEQEDEHNVVKKFAFPDVHVGSVVEIEYTLRSPFYYTFRSWEFQSDIPKISSEYWATIPANFIYNMTITGFLRLSENESSLVSDCFTPNGNLADCTLHKFGMVDIPAFVNEDYMTSPRNFISAISFEISEIKFFEGGSKKFTLTWNDAQNILARDDGFGVQLKKGKDLLKLAVPLIGISTDSLQRARAIYEFVRSHYAWDGNFGKYSRDGIKKAFDKGGGNVGDINLSLIAMLRASGLKAVPVILSTRDHGVPFEDMPLITDYNYVIALFHAGGRDYLLDATDRELPFGMIPERCLNGKGRALEENISYWYPLTPSDASKEYSVVDLSLNNDGNLKGTITRRFTGYAAYDKRSELDKYSGIDKYIKQLEGQFTNATISNYKVLRRDTLDKPLVETFQISFAGMNDLKEPVILFNPFMVGQIKENPFKLPSRQYPVDFGTPIERTYSVHIQLPDGYKVDNLPDNLNLTLYGTSGHYACSSQVVGNAFSVSYLLSITKPVFSPAEYGPLKEFYSRIVQSEATDVVLKSAP